jgi:hypothetical protein
VNRNAELLDGVFLAIKHDASTNVDVVIFRGFLTNDTFGLTLVL